ncbi:cation acetate symporter [Pseudonocardia oroxyli]|uniref:Sodium:solute symporter family protein n=1 Tax=Pseudonocardia oroxyli TaxID=366584 RepID=A0A1G7M220_PSEOR|nr:cation acetate symporter [Pseudonocardia oroxyli]SDF55220.1 Sodium:solute symporter family protein [Pseudonocardia oroxyli]
MDTPSLVALVAIGLVGIASVLIGTLGVRVARSTSDFLVASRTVGAVPNAAAISGEYLSAATFLGVAGIVLREGADGLWYPIAFCAGYLALLLLVAAPLRRSGAYTIPDFAEARLHARGLRRLCTGLVLLIGWLYLLPQLQGAGLALTTLTTLPGWVGVVGAGVLVILSVVGGGMRSITFVQAFQYWLKLTALTVPALIALALFLGSGRELDRPTAPVFAEETTVSVETPVRLEVAADTALRARGTVDGAAVDGPLVWAPGVHDVQAGTELRFAAGSGVPVPAGAPPTDREWLEPHSGGATLLEIYSIMIAGIAGTMGLPHVLVRFYTNPDGRAARRTTVVVLAMIGAVFALVSLLGLLSRAFTPELLVDGRTDGAVLLVPTAVLGDGWAGWLLGGLVSAGAAAAFLSTSSGLVVSLAGVLFTDVLSGRLRDFRIAAVLSAIVPVAPALLVGRMDFALTVPLVFAVAAATFCPLLVLGVWWRGLTPTGAVAGLLVGALLSCVGVASTLVGSVPEGAFGVLLLRPAAVAVPAAFLTMIVVSRLTKATVPADVDRTLLQLHAPERLGLSRERLDSQ